MDLNLLYQKCTRNEPEQCPLDDAEDMYFVQFGLDQDNYCKFNLHIKAENELWILILFNQAPQNLFLLV